jgi:hypothetical protein
VDAPGQTVWSRLELLAEAGSESTKRRERSLQRLLASGARSKEPFPAPASLGR